MKKLNQRIQKHAAASVILNRGIKKRVAAAMVLSMLSAGTFSFSAQASSLDDARDFIIGVKDKIVEVLDNTGIGPAVKNGYDTVTDFVFTYETQPDDSDMENLARSWAVTMWLADEEKGESNIYYFDNHTLRMVEDPTQIGRGYNLKKTPEGSSLNGVHTGILKAVVADATNYTINWVNYDDELNMYLLQKMQEKKDTTADTETPAAETPATEAPAAEASAVETP